MISIFQMIIYFSIGIFSGFMSGMFGIGGGSVRTPLLYVAGLPLLDSYGINLLVIPFSSLIGAVTHRKNIDFSIAKYMIIGGGLGTLSGAFLVGALPTLTLAIIFVVVSIVTILGVHLERIFPKIAKKFKPNMVLIVIGAFFLNFLTVLRGGSGGSLFPPFLKALGFDIRKAIATSLFSTIFTASVGIVVFWSRGNVDFFPALAVIVGSVAGSRIGSLKSLKTEPLWLEIGLSILIVFFAMIVLIKSI
ncbi:MAG TPA: sulfite exporter TauE/SafE family protein [Thermotogaceae bacterium]|nr:sulfite exporter TauE/SafE family protein [Thermotogaceae bacterium]